jgi:hypothetical protein
MVDWGYRLLLLMIIDVCWVEIENILFVKGYKFFKRASL